MFAQKANRTCERERGQRMGNCLWSINRQKFGPSPSIACVDSRKAAYSSFFQAPFPQKFEHFNLKTMQNGQPASPLAGGLPPKSPEVEKLSGI